MMALMNEAGVEAAVRRTIDVGCKIVGRRQVPGCTSKQQGWACQLRSWRQVPPWGCMLLVEEPLQLFLRAVAGLPRILCPIE